MRTHLINNKAKSATLATMALIFTIGLTACGGANAPSGLTEEQISGPGRDSEYLKATRVFGPLVISKGDLQSGESFASLKTVPWSGWWFPVTDPYIWQEHGSGKDNLSPLQKYDLYVQRTRGQAAHSAQWEHENVYQPPEDEGSGWAGHCDAFAQASLLEAEPVDGIWKAGIHFTRGDLKALLIKAYEKVESAEYYGLKFDGSEEGGVPEDIYPDQFLRVAQATLFEKNQPFIIDKDPGIAVWNVPIYAADIQYQPDASNVHLLHVRMGINGADSTRIKDYEQIGTDVLTKIYTFDLLGNHDADGNFHVIFGKWTGESKKDHPDRVEVLPQGRALHHSKNPEVNADLVQEIVDGARRRQPGETLPDDIRR